MFAKQAKARERARPLDDRSHLQHARALLAKLDTVSGSVGPARVVMSAPPPMREDRMEGETDPSELGGCFSDIIDRARGDHEEAIQEEDAEENP